MKNKIFLFGTALALMSCDNVKTEYSNQLQEKAVIVTLIYSPSEHKTEITQTAYDGLGTGFVQTGTDFNGNTGVKINSTHQITSTTIPERFGVVFQCQHGTFTIEGTEQKYKVLYNKLLREQGDTVNILYKEEYAVKYGKKEGSDKEVELSRTLNKLDFIDAQIINTHCCKK